MPDPRGDPATLATSVVGQELAHKDFALTVTQGPDKGAVFPLDASHPSRTLVGQGTSCDVRLTDREVSRRHLSLERSGPSLRATDLGSMNGTFVDRVKIHVAELRGGEFVRIGATVLRVDATLDEARAAAAIEPVTATSSLRGVVGDSPEMRRLRPLFERIAAALVPVIIEGETGTGKEVLAEALHDAGPRKEGPFVVFDCTAVPAALLESELFGHERGAFTGAVSQRKGIFEQASGGTLFIDEIGELELSLQPKLLRALERSEVRRVGGDRWIAVDARIIAATRRDLDHEVEVGRFRDDLYHRLAVARVDLPPLRSRRGDVTVLARHFWAQLAGTPSDLTPELLLRWEDYAWPGNVRELRNAVARQIALGEFATTVARKAPPVASTDICEAVIAEGLSLTEARDRVIEYFQQRYVEHVLAQNDGNVAKAAEMLGIGRRYLQKLRARQRDDE